MRNSDSRIIIVTARCIRMFILGLLYVLLVHLLRWISRFFKRHQNMDAILKSATAAAFFYMKFSYVPNRALLLSQSVSLASRPSV